MFWDPLISLYENSRPIDWAKQFDHQSPLDVEIGSGLGEFIVECAKANPLRNFVGIECDRQRVEKILKRLNQGYFRNVRIFQADARLIFSRFLRSSSVSIIYVLFPCPWPKRCHIKNRLLTRDFFRLLNNRLVKDGMMKIVTDYYPYAQWIESQLSQTGFRLEKKTIEPQFNTKFERKWLAFGQKEFYEIQLYKVEHIDIPVLEDIPLREFSLQSFEPERFETKDYKGSEGCVIFKEFSYDAKNHKGFIHALVIEQEISQQLWVMIVRKTRVWVISLLTGFPVILTPGVKKAFELIYESALDKKDNIVRIGQYEIDEELSTLS